MKAGWERRRLGDMIEIQNGFAFNSMSFSDSGGMPLVRIRDLKKGIDTEVSYIGEFEEKYIINSGDLLVGMDGEFRCYEWKGKQALLNQRVCRLQKFKDSLFDRFVFYGINKYLKDIEESTGFTTVKHLSSKKISDIVFPLPPLQEQRRIVAILDEAFAGIAAAKEKAEQNLKNAKEVFEAYLQDTFKQFISGENGIPLNNLCELIVDCEHKTAPTGDGLEYPLIRTPNIGKGELVLDNVKTVSHENYLKWTRRAIPQEEDLILAREAPAGNIAVIPKNIKVCLGQRTVLLRTKKNKLFSRYLAYLMLSKDVQMKLLEHSRGATVQHINMKDIRLFKIYDLLHLDKQRQIVSELDNLSAETSVLESIYQQKLSNLQELKKSLLQQAFSGAL